MPWRAAASTASSDDVGRRLGQRREDAARVKPAHAVLAEEALPVDVPGSKLRDRRMAAVGDAEGTPHAEAALREVQSVPRRPAAAIVSNPAHERRVDSALQDEVLDEPADVVVDECGHHRGAQAEAPAQPTRDVVLAASLPDIERAGVSDPSVARVESQHHLAECDEIEPALARGSRRECHVVTAAATATASAVSRRIASKSSEAIRSGATIQLPPTAATFGTAR